MLSSAREPKSANNYGISKLMSFTHDTHVVAVFVAVRSVLRDSLLFMENQNKGQLDHLRDTLLQVADRLTSLQNSQNNNSEGKIG